ncbi:hypothetical protein PSTT_04723 [Puccinia striiformis]|uniref:Uncharacterized protein n=1 Tax=Puccinia striiformis TaxID=27350 RepID=A0A2S4VRM8_9BASI|nr:hypothetical protein PSTT_04723 [Puccinia striiformis]
MDWPVFVRSIPDDLPINVNSQSIMVLPPSRSPDPFCSHPISLFIQIGEAASALHDLHR